MNDNIARVYHPFEQHIDYDKFSITITKDDIDTLETTLFNMVINESNRIIEMQQEMRNIYKNFIIGMNGTKNSKAFQLILNMLHEI